jgi:hypothetical protein
MPRATVSASNWATRTVLSNTNSGSSAQVRLPQKRKPLSERISAVTCAALSTPASLAMSSMSQWMSCVRPTTPETATFDRVLCGPVCSSISARRPMARAAA